MDVREKLVELIYNSSPRLVEEESEILAKRLIDNGVTVQQWIPVTERLPENYEAVLTFDGRSIHIMGHHHDFKDPFGIAKGNFMGCAPITHWMPLPEPPKGE